MVDDAVSKEAIKHVSEVNFAAILEMRNLLSDESSASSRWIMATLITLNAGAMFGLSNVIPLSQSTRLVCVLMLSAGIFFAVMLGYATILAVQSLSKPINDLADAWMTSMLREYIDLDELLTLETLLVKKAKPWKILTHIAGWLSLLLFFAAIISAVASAK